MTNYDSSTIGRRVSCYTQELGQIIGQIAAVSSKYVYILVLCASDASPRSVGKLVAVPNDSEYISIEHPALTI